jgi:hypothetical protein
MTGAESRTLRVQVLLLLLVLAGSVALAVALVTQRALIERHLGETYAPLPANLKTVADAAAAGDLAATEFSRLPAAERELLYDEWMAHAEPASAHTPRVLGAADPDLYLARAERTLVCGRDEQRLRALRFLELANMPKSAAVLARALAWSKKRKLAALSVNIGETMQRIRLWPVPQEQVDSRG